LLSLVIALAWARRRVDFRHLNTRAAASGGCRWLRECFYPSGGSGSGCAGSQLPGLVIRGHANEVPRTAKYAWQVAARHHGRAKPARANHF
jgi:hypothetical protein